MNDHIIPDAHRHVRLASAALSGEVLHEQPPCDAIDATRDELKRNGTFAIVQARWFQEPVRDQPKER
jgi:hypothetical protein